MLATLNSRQIVDEIVKDTVKDNDPHDAIQISPEVVRASRPSSEAPTLAPELTIRPEPKFAPEPKVTMEPKFSLVLEPQAAKPQAVTPQTVTPQAAAPSVDTAVRVTASDDHVRPKRSAAGKWLRGAFVTFLFAGGSAAATIAWEKHGDTATQMLAQWTPALASLLPSTSTSQTAPVAAAQAAPPAAQQDQTADSTAPPPAAPVATAAAAPAATQADAASSAESMTRDIAAMALQIEQLKASIAELKAGQEQMVREMAKPPAPKPVAEVKPVSPPARASALAPRAPAPLPPPARKPKPVVSRTYMPAYSPPPIAPPPPPSQAAAVPPPAAPPVATTQAVADDDGPVVRPPMPVH
ncbi:hypothetical protein ACFQZO_13465 [Bradyrhizobium sp. GCM10027634]|uniref:hypothetical protein n=1 Tax=unclassified Bradyrhizobium TaxID=2631580 RepID=UPI00188C2128|nr:MULTISPECIES: hypothetical protein [unclassified Bradyrhizobium]MDN5001897.1 hypothetical protein [Bradyrhizobium sp. WYCCWR 12677]QOZ45810.1 hypothetical protein XH89_21760 [Bradyrhizobium sp. CCBAU 53340]